ncbi:MAG: HNH endonuclease [Candidatus Moranbacteria bacterium]|nr:HNH endonuclease [Candidatus Moranbacteria bacterium]
MPQVKCKICDKEFYAKPSALQNGLGKYCSKICMRKGLQKGEVRKCFICDVEVYKSRKALLGSKSEKFFCGKSCQTVWRNSIVNIGSNHPNWKGGRHVSYRNVLNKNNVPKVCVFCGNTDGRVLAVHHIDNNHRNNALENLSWLCYNCHILVHNHTKEREKFLKLLKTE